MAQRVSILLVDDIDGTEAAETVTFALDGATYEIDLNESNAAALRDALASYVGAGRKVGRSGSRAARTPATGAGSKEERDAIREWSRTAAAKKAGIEPLGDRGRIPSGVVEAWQAAK